MLIITGPIGSGMRELARFCRRMGFETGGDAGEAQQVGEEEALRINQAILQKIEGRGSRSGTILGKLGALVRPALRKNPGGSDKDGLRKEHEDAIRNLSCAVIVDSRFMRCPALLEIWHAIRGDMRVLLTYRAPESSPVVDRLREDFSDCIETLLKQDIAFRFLLYPRFLAQAESVCAALSDLGLVFDAAEGERIWKELVDSGTAAPGSASLTRNETQR